MTPTDILAKVKRPNEQVLDHVYWRFAPSDPFMAEGRFVDHVTMGSEALVGLGLGREVDGWVSRQPVRPYAAPRTGISIQTAWRQALGRRECHGDWLAYFENEVATSPFQDVLACWVPRFAHAVDALLFHGLIRTGHAVRALSHEDTPARRGELARGLALWAVGIQGPSVDRTPDDRAQQHFASLDILRYAQAGAAAFAAEPTIPNLHLVTGPMAYMLMYDRLDPRLHPLAVTAFERTHANALRDLPRLEATAASEPIPALDRDLLDSLTRQRDAHPIKLTEAALRGYEATNADVFLRAIGRVRHPHGVRGLLGLARALLRRVA
jgi:hypothetical protein